MTDIIAVVKPEYLLEAAYGMGFDKFHGLTGDETEGFDISYFKESATWSSHVAPKLRAMAGFEDSGHGTYQGRRKVAAIEPGAEEDEPAPAELVDSQTVFTNLVAAFDQGANDAVDGRDKEPPHW